jgi:type IV fimbrial biogenesis protein FimT
VLTGQEEIVMTTVFTHNIAARPVRTTLASAPGGGRCVGLSRRPSACAGFTVIELAITLTIFALLMVTVAPSASAWVASKQIRVTAESIQTGLQRARMEAVRRNRPVRFSLVASADPAMLDDECALSASSASWVISINDPAGKCAAAPSNTSDPMLVETYAAGVHARQIVVQATEADGATAADSVTFDGFGRVADGGLARISIDNAVAGNDYRPLAIVISEGGGIRMCDPRVSTDSDPRAC